ncbi:MAG TPA: hypothetical protein VM840_08200 [Actinomycetota bacterium]|nr:hypothetical protein [Actinomycetota bacterium]
MKTLARLVLALCMAASFATPVAADAMRIHTVSAPGLTWLPEPPGPTPTAAVRCSDATWGRLADRFTVAGMPALQRMELVTGGMPANLDASAVWSALSQAGRTWNDEANDCGRPDRSGFGFWLAGARTAMSTITYDGVNTVRFSSNLCEQRTHVACILLQSDPETGKPQGWDIVLDPLYPWGTSAGPWLDLRAVLTHELGHAIGLADQGRSATTCDPRRASLTMFSCTWPGDTVKRTLALGDALGVEGVSSGA